MSDSACIIPHSAFPLPLPSPRVPVTIRPATPADVPFMDGLQKRHRKQVGWMPTAQLEGKVAAGQVLVAEEVASGQLPVASEGGNGPSPLATDNWQLATPVPLGYCIASDRYFKRDDVGIVYQMNVAPGRQRGLIGAALLQAQFDRSAYGCRLYCCWCAQDIAANQFWEAMGFVPLAFRTGSGPKGRTHLFWQKRIRRGDATTPYWFPAQTNAGSLREDRLVLPIPPGTHWSDAKPILLPTAQSDDVGHATACRPRADETEPARSSVPYKKPKPVAKPPAPPVRPAGVSMGGLWFAPTVAPAPAAAPAAVEKPRREPKPKAKNDPRQVAAARELRDRWLEEVNAGRYLPAANPRYEVCRMLRGGGTAHVTAQLPALGALALPAPRAA